MLSFINIILIILAVLAVFYILSGYKENFELMPKQINEKLILEIQLNQTN